jgi:hypothetical protein
MRFQVLKDFQGNGQMLPRGAFVELTPSPRTQILIESRYLLPADPVVEAQTKTPENQQADEIVRRRMKKD